MAAVPHPGSTQLVRFCLGAIVDPREAEKVMCHLTACGECTAIVGRILVSIANAPKYPHDVLASTQN